jgi:hypothetical protein
MTPDAADERGVPSIAEVGPGMMEHGIAIAAVTEALWNLLQRELDPVLPGIRITARSPNKARDDGGGRQLNLFLYQVTEDRLGTNVGHGAENRTRLSLNLYYLVSAYGPDDHEMNSACHAVLTEAMRVLHDHPVVFLGQQRNMNPTPIHVALHPLTLDDLSKLWAAFQTPYQLSVAYEVSSVLVGGARQAQLSG